MPVRTPKSAARRLPLSAAVSQFSPADARARAYDDSQSGSDPRMGGADSIRFTPSMSSARALGAFETDRSHQRSLLSRDNTLIASGVAVVLGLLVAIYLTRRR